MSNWVFCWHLMKSSLIGSNQLRDLNKIAIKSFPPFRSLPGMRWTGPYLLPLSRCSARSWHIFQPTPPGQYLNHKGSRSFLYKYNVEWKFFFFFSFLSPLTLERDFWLASIVTSPAQQTRALELDRPELGGMVPSTTHDIPASWAIPNFSCAKQSRTVTIKHCFTCVQGKHMFKSTVNEKQFPTWIPLTPQRK